MPDPSIPPRPPALGPSYGPIPRADLLSLVLADQRRRWRRGERVAVEAYVERLPFLREDRGALLDVVVNEINLREDAGEPVDRDEYRRRFPDLAGPLVWRLALHRSAAGSILTVNDGTPMIPAPPSEPLPPQPVVPEPLASDTPQQPSPIEPPVVSPSVDERLTTIGRAWNWCRRHPAPTTVLTVAAACLLFGMFADFTGRANPTAPPTNDPADDPLAELRRARERAERDAAEARRQSAADHEEAQRLKAAADERVTQSTKALADLRRSLDSLFAEIGEDDVPTNTVANRLIDAGKGHFEAVVRGAGADPARRGERGRALVWLGRMAERQKQPEEAIGYLRQAVEALSGTDDRPLLARTYVRLGRLEREAGRLAEAEAAGRKGVDTWDAVGAAEAGHDAAARRELAIALSEFAESLAAAKRFADAAAVYRRSVETWQAADAGDEPDSGLMYACERLADCLAVAGQADAAVDARRQAVDLFRLKRDDTADDPVPAEGLARNLTRLAESLREPADAVNGYTEAAAAWEHAARLRPGTDALVNAAAATDRVADLQRQLGDAAAADRSAEQAVALRERLLAKYPDEPGTQSILASVYTARGERLRDANRDDEAAAEFRRATPLIEALATRSPQDVSVGLRLAVNQMCLAQLDLRRRRIEPARDAYTRAVARLNELDKLTPNSDDLAVNRAVCCVNLGQLAAMDHIAKDAGAWYDRAEHLLKPLAEQPRWKEFVAGALADCARGRAEVADRPRGR